MKRSRMIVAAAALVTSIASASSAGTVNVSFTKLTGLVGGSPAETAVYRATIPAGSLSEVVSITINDASKFGAGSPGKFSGFDLDAIKLSGTSVASASGASGLAGLSVFDFGAADTFFTAGSQAAPVSPALFGTLGGQLNNSVATLGAFDGNSTTGPGADGFISMGYGGKLAFNLTSPVLNDVPLYLYIGEVGNNGESPSGAISVSDLPVALPPPPPTCSVPVPAAAWTGLSVIGSLGMLQLRRRRTA